MASYAITKTIVREQETKSPSQNQDENANVRKKGQTLTDSYKVLFWEFKTPLKWINIISITLFHLWGVYMILTHDYFGHLKLLLFGFMMGGISGFGVTAGVHRYWTHRSYKAKTPLRVILLICYSIAGQNTIIEWVKDHRVHHKFSETDADPHNSNRGFFFAHVGWLMMKKHPEVLRKGGQLDFSDLYNDPLVMFDHKYHTLLKLIFCFLIPTMIPPFLWNEFWMVSAEANLARYMLSLNFTWCVNSAAHIWGFKPYDVRINPVENLSVSFFAMGEGYHNYHHTFPWDYRAAELGSRLNITTIWLNFFERIGWAYDMKSPSNELVMKVAAKHGDGSLNHHQEIPQDADVTKIH